MKRGNTPLLIFILILFGFCLWVILPGSGIFGRDEFKLGLDLKGGSHLIYSIDLSKKDPAQTDADVIEGVKSKIERRVNAYGVTEPIVQTIRNERGSFVLVQLPGVKDIDEAMKLIGQTAELDFREIVLDVDGKPVLDEEGREQWVKATARGSDEQERELTGKYLKPNAQVDLTPQTNEPEVAFEWNSEGAILFEQITQRNLQKPLGIFLDDQLISAPTVQAVIKERGVITGLNLDEARTLAIQLNSGSLDVPLTVVERRDIGATLGEDSLRKSLMAGIIGAAMVVLFMIAYYRFSGFVTCLALVVFVALNLAIFKLLPVVLTLPGIAGFIVSIGMGVDGNVLVAERLKEELRRGRTLGAAIEESFRQSWSAIFDANVTVFIVCAVLYWLGNTFGNFLVVGFATTLFIGTALSMFTQVVVTRTFMRTFVGLGVAKSPAAYGVLRQ
ncbi:MAG: protein translocase subunit SecD [Chloroflexi bacterium]|nr:protein translocase subunit SecD [Chloroflexota bacterium]MBL7061223.1 protein translocase subunit SecD [Dehalococcoidia bacterium]